MPKVVALSNFDHDGPRRRGDEFEVGDAHVAGLVRANLVYRLDDCDVPRMAAGVQPQSCASQAAQASNRSTATLSAHGASVTRRAES